MKSINKEVKIGIAGIIALCIVVYGLNYLKGINMFQPTNYFYAHFENVNGLTKSSPVFADGVRIGIVRNIDYDYNKPKNITVQVELDKAFGIPKGSYAELVAEFMGGIRMNLHLSDNIANQHNIGDTIPGILNKGAMDEMAQMMPTIKNMLPKLDSILTGINAIVNDKNIPETMQSVKETTANLSVASAELRVLLGKDIPQLTTKLNKIGDNFLAISNNLKEIDYAKSIKQIDETIHNVKIITSKLQSTDNSMGLLLNSRDFYDNLNTTTVNASSLLKDLKENPKRYVHFSIFGK